MTGQQTVAEAVRQMIEGEDYTPLEQMLADLSPEQATRKPDGSPYSIATVVWHTWYWNAVWVADIGGDPAPLGGTQPENQWPEVAAGEWLELRGRILHVLQRVQSLSGSEDTARLTGRGEAVGKLLLQVALHSAYHIGQIALIRQELGLWPPVDGE